MQYTDEEMKAMAKSCEWYASNNPNMYTQFLMVMSMYTSTAMGDVHKQIVELANK